GNDRSAPRTRSRHLRGGPERQKPCCGTAAGGFPEIRHSRRGGGWDEDFLDGSAWVGLPKCRMDGFLHVHIARYPSLARKVGKVKSLAPFSSSGSACPRPLPPPALEFLRHPNQLPWLLQ